MGRNTSELREFGSSIGWSYFLRKSNEEDFRHYALHKFQVRQRTITDPHTHTHIDLTHPNYAGQIWIKIPRLHSEDDNINCRTKTL